MLIPQPHGEVIDENEECDVQLPLRAVILLVRKKNTPRVLGRRAVAQTVHVGTVLLPVEDLGLKILSLKKHVYSGIWKPLGYTHVEYWEHPGHKNSRDGFAQRTTTTTPTWQYVYHIEKERLVASLSVFSFSTL
jgi:hypothetical protein